MQKQNPIAHSRACPASVSSQPWEGLCFSVSPDVLAMTSCRPWLLLSSVSEDQSEEGSVALVPIFFVPLSAGMVSVKNGALLIEFTS